MQLFSISGISGNPSRLLFLDFLVYNNSGFGFNRPVLVDDP